MSKQSTRATAGEVVGIAIGMFGVLLLLEIIAPDAEVYGAVALIGAIAAVIWAISQT